MVSAILFGIEPGRGDHLGAADRHLEAAETHDRAAKYWEDQGDPDRAALQHDMAEYERAGAELERRWAALTERDSIA